MDPDHRLLLRNTKPLLQSRSAAVVMAVAQLYFHLAPKAEVGVIAKALVRLLRSHRCAPAPPAPPTPGGRLAPLPSAPERLTSSAPAHLFPAQTPVLPSPRWCPPHTGPLLPPILPTSLLPTCCPSRGAQVPLTPPLHSEVQYVVLQNVATMSIKRRVSK